jgi:hypothetical protein
MMNPSGTETVSARLRHSPPPALYLVHPQELVVLIVGKLGRHDGPLASEKQQLRLLGQIANLVRRQQRTARVMLAVGNA